MVGAHAMGFCKRMNDHDKTAAGAVFLLAALGFCATAAFAQAVPTPQDTARTIPGLVIATPTPNPAQTPVPVPTDPVRGLPAPTPTPSTAAKTPAAKPPARARDVPPRSEKEPTSAAARAPRDGPTPAASPSATLAPMSVATPTAMPTSPPVPVATVAPGATAQSDHGPWPWLAAAAVALSLAALAYWALVRRRSAARSERWVEEPIPSEPPAPAPIVVPVRPSGPQASLTVALRPIRAGLNLLSATVEAEVVVGNTGDAAATQVRLHAALLSAHAAQEAELAAVYAAPPGRPAAPAFALAPGEERRVRIVVALSRESVRSIDVGGRPMFVPLVAIDLRYAADEDGTAARRGQAFIVGIERVDSAKLAPFWLDGPLRMHDQVAARGQGPAVVE